MIVTAPSGKTVNLRNRPSLVSKIIRQIPVGADVTVTKEYDAEWSEVSYRGYTGFIMTKFLINSDTSETISALKTKLQQALNLLDKLEA